MAKAMEKETQSGFDVTAYLANAGPGRRIVQLDRDEAFFSQGDPADCVFYLHKGRVKITVISAGGKEATIRLVNSGSFFGEKAMEAEPGPRVTNAIAINVCTALRVSRQEFLRVMHEERVFSDMFSLFLLENSLRTQANLVDQLFNSAERRLARLLLLMAEWVPSEGELTLIPPISQEVLASMIGSTRPRINLFMNRFRKLGFVEYDGRIKVHKSLLQVFLRD
jgi:CRP-like cAMP-binding protein